jgi:hypothetical protein
MSRSYTSSRPLRLHICIVGLLYLLVLQSIKIAEIQLPLGFNGLNSVAVLVLKTKPIRDNCFVKLNSDLFKELAGMFIFCEHTMENDNEAKSLHRAFKLFL